MHMLQTQSPLPWQFIVGLVLIVYLNIDPSVFMCLGTVGTLGLKELIVNFLPLQDRHSSIAGVWLNQCLSLERPS